MTVSSWIFWLTGAIPIWQAWRALRHTSLCHALAWAAAAWLGWGAVLLAEANATPAVATAARYVALCLVGCAGMAVLGARRPGVAAWNFVVMGLLAVFLLFLAEGFLAGGELQLGPLRVAFLGITLAIGILNYLPTRMAPAALLLGLGCGLELWVLIRRDASSPAALDVPYAKLLILLAPATALAAAWLPARSAAEVDRLWRGFRDAFGLIWGLRLREQFNRAAANAELAVELTWTRLRSTESSGPQATAGDASLAILRALLKRFAAETPEDAPSGG